MTLVPGLVARGTHRPAANEVDTALVAGLPAPAPGTRILANGVTGGGLSLSANDVEIIFDGSSRLGTLSFGHGTQRVRVVGGQWSGVRFPIPASWDGGGPSYRSDWMGLSELSPSSSLQLMLHQHSPIIRVRESESKSHLEGPSEEVPGGPGGVP